MRYCRRCILPDTRPNLTLDREGVCNACRAHETKKAHIDWAQRERSFRTLVKEVRARHAAYDCVVPVSGGKDSTWQVVRCLESGLHPLAVTWKPPFRTELGRKNLENLVSLGVDHLDFQINPKVERRFLLKSFEKYGTTAIPMHMAIFTLPVRVAARFGIPLIVWGENSAFEYGGTQEEQRGFVLDEAWFKKYGVTQGTTAHDWVSADLSEADLAPYMPVPSADLEKADLRAVFLGYFFRWDPQETLRVAEAHGFQRSSEGPITGYYDYADLDDEFIAIHHWLKWYKFGFTRTYDNLSLEIRNGRLTRDEAIQILARKGDETPQGAIRKFCDYVGITEARFYEVAERFRNREIWTRKNGSYHIQEFLVEGWKWA